MSGRPEPTWPPGVRAILLFDGVCGFCNATVQFLLRFDRQAVLSFTPLQGETAAGFLSSAERQNLDSVVLLTPQRIYRRTSAVIQTLRLIGWPWRLAVVFLLVPVKLRDFLYDAFAKRRYRWFGKLDQCRLPSAAERARFLP